MQLSDTRSCGPFRGRSDAQLSGRANEGSRKGKRPASSASSIPPGELTPPPEELALGAPVTPSDALLAKALVSKSTSKAVVPEKAASKAAAVAAVASGKAPPPEVQMQNTLEIIRVERANLEASKVEWLSRMDRREQQHQERCRQFEAAAEARRRDLMADSQNLFTAEFASRSREQAEYKKALEE